MLAARHPWQHKQPWHRCCVTWGQGALPQTPTRLVLTRMSCIRTGTGSEQHGVSCPTIVKQLACHPASGINTMDATVTATETHGSEDRGLPVSNAVALP